MLVLDGVRLLPLPLLQDLNHPLTRKPLPRAI